MADTSKLQAIDVKQFKGVNTIDDPISLDPAESPYCLNMDITKTAAMQTRFGYELVSEIAGATGAMRGILPYYRTYGSNSGDYLMLFHNNGNAYYVSNANLTPTLIGSYGADGGQVRGRTFNNLAIFENGETANSILRWDVSSMIPLTGAPPDANVFGTFATRFFCNNVQNPSAVHYSDIDNPDAGLGTNIPFSINIGDGQDVTALVSNNDFLQVFKEDSIYGINITYNTLTGDPEPIYDKIVQTQGGCYAKGSVQPVYGYSYYLSKKGFESYGPSQQRVVADFSTPLSMKIDPTIRNINFKYRDNINSAYWEQKYMCAVPMGGSVSNDYILVYNEYIKRRFGIDNWSVYNGIPALAFAIFRDSDKKDRLYFVSQFEPKLFKFNTSFSDDGFGYNRIWRSKTFQFGERTHWHYIDLEGAIPQGARVYVDLYSDGVTVSGNDNNELQIDQDNLVLSATGGGYIGDNYIGDSYVGGAEAGETTPMYKFKKRVRFPDTVNMGYNSWFQLRNSAVGQGWRLSRFKLVFDSEPEEPTYSRAEK
jgi:hypothetical protein